MPIDKASTLAALLRHHEQDVAALDLRDAKGVPLDEIHALRDVG